MILLFSNENIYVSKPLYMFNNQWILNTLWRLLDISFE